MAGREEVSDAIDEVIRKAVPSGAIYNLPIQSVTKKTNSTVDGAVSYYQIDTEQKTFYAQNVVAGLGIGGHKLPVKSTDPPQVLFNWRKANEAFPNRFNGLPRIMDLDTFQRAVIDGKLVPGRLSSNTVKKLVVVGPNAVIDAMTTALRKNFFSIVWITKSRDDPTFLPGTDNTHVATTYREVMKHRNVISGKPEVMTFTHKGITVIQHDYLSSVAQNNGITVTYGERKDERPGKNTPEQVRGTVQGDIMVYGLGPDLEPIKEVFGDTLSDLAPVYDVNRRFNYRRVAPAEVAAAVANVLKESDAGEVAQILDGTPSLQNIVDVPIERGKNEPLPGTLPAAIGLKVKSRPGDETSLEFIGGAAFRLAEDKEVGYTYISEKIDNLKTAVSSLPATLQQFANQILSNEKFGDVTTRFLTTLGTYLKDAGELAAKLEKGTGADVTSLLPLAKGDFEALYTTLKSKDRRSAATLLISDVFAGAENLRAELLELSATFSTALAANKNAQPWKASERMKAVPYSLPKNILLNDQLTPSRSQAEAASGFIPPKIARRVDFVSADHTAIANHIAEKYRHLPPVLADYITARIVYERRHLGEDKARCRNPVRARLQLPACSI